jgi:hypothetical protein
MAKIKQQVFTIDRRKEFRLRLEAKKNGKKGQDGSFNIMLKDFPEPELVDRIIERVRQL